jgi:O-antigen/teichoic acid export membrane protein
LFTAQRIIRNALLSSSSQAWNLLVAIFLTPYLLFKLGTEGFAIWSLTYVLVSSLVSLDLGLKVTLTRFVATSCAKNKMKSISEFLGTAFWISLGLDLTVAGIIILFSDQYLNFLNVPAARLAEARFVLSISALILALTNPFALFQSSLYGFQRLDWVASINVLAATLSAGGTVLVLQSGWGLYGLVLNAAWVELVNAFLFLFAVRRLLRPGGMRLYQFNFQAAREMLAYGARIQVTGLGSLASTQFGKILAGHFLTLSSVAAYELGLRVASNITLIPVWSMAAVLPAASEMAILPDRARLVELYRRGTKYVWIGATLLAGLVWLTAPQILAVWTAAPQPEAALVTRWLAVAFGINLVTAVGTTIARGIGRAGLETRYAILVLVMQLVGTTIFARSFGLTGLLVANALAISIGSGYFVLLFHRELAQSVLPWMQQILLRPILVTVLLAALGALPIGQIPLSLTDRPIGILVLGIAAGIYVAFYLAGLAALGYIQSGDFLVFRGAIRRISAAGG